MLQLEIGSRPNTFAHAPRSGACDIAPLGRWSVCVCHAVRKGRRADAAPWGLVEERLEDEAETGFVGEELGMS